MRDRVWIALLIVSVLLVTGIRAAAWHPVGPPELPVVAYAPVEAPRGTDRTLANATLEVHGATFEVDVIGREARGLYGYRVRVFHVDGDGGRVWPAEVRMESPRTWSVGAYDREPEHVRVHRAGFLEAWIDHQPCCPHPRPVEYRVIATFDAYREWPLGVTRDEAVTVELSFPLATEP